jgi:endonuclease III
VELQRRFNEFDGIGQKKAAMAVEILERDLGVPIALMDCSDIAFDVHVRRVFLRSRLADRDDADHMIAVARELHRSRPGALDFPAWHIGCSWCHAGTPDCGDCPLTHVCPKDIERAARVASGSAEFSWSS